MKIFTTKDEDSAKDTAFKLVALRTVEKLSTNGACDEVFVAATHQIPVKCRRGLRSVEFVGFIVLRLIEEGENVWKEAMSVLGKLSSLGTNRTSAQV